MEKRKTSSRTSSSKTQCNFVWMRFQNEFDTIVHKTFNSKFQFQLQFVFFKKSLKILTFWHGEAENFIKNFLIKAQNILKFSFRQSTLAGGNVTAKQVDGEKGQVGCGVSSSGLQNQLNFNSNKINKLQGYCCTLSFLKQMNNFC